MSPLKKLSKIERAILLYKVFPSEKSFLLLALEATIAEINANRTKYQQRWEEDKTGIPFSTFYRHAKSVKSRLTYSRKQIESDTMGFARNLFADNSYKFTLYCLKRIVDGMSTNFAYNQLALFLFFSPDAAEL